jgi:hypothetical protein
VEHVTGQTQAGGSPGNELSGLAFDTIHKLLGAGRLLKERGLDIVVVPRRVAGCGALLLVESTAVTGALALLTDRGFAPSAVTVYPNPEEAL